MTIAPVQSQSAADAQNVTPENLLANKHLTEGQKIARGEPAIQKHLCCNKSYPKRKSR